MLPANGFGGRRCSNRWLHRRSWRNLHAIALFLVSILGSLSFASVALAQSATTTTVSGTPNPANVGQSVQIQITVTPTTVTVVEGGGVFLDFGDGSSSNLIYFVGQTPPEVLTASHTYAASGSYTVTATWLGSLDYQSSSGTTPLTVNGVATTTTLTSSQNPSVFGQAVTFTATVSGSGGTPTGTVTFLDGGTSIGTGTLSGGVATFTTSSLAVSNNHVITASYGGNSTFNSSTGSLTGNPQVVNKGTTVTTLTSSQNPSTLGQAVTFTATVSAVSPAAGTPTGTVTFLDGGTSIGTGTLSGGVATLTTSTLAAGNHTITASYSGDSNFGTSTGSLTNNPQVVNKGATTVTLTSSQNPSALGQAITFTATVSGGGGTATGTVTFLDGGTSIGTGTLSGGVATLTTSTLAAGNHTITANYSGDSNFSASTGSLANNPQVVNKPGTTVTLTSSQNPSVFGHAITFTATVSGSGGTPTGTVTFLDGGTSIGTGTLSGGVATLTTSTLAVGNHTITATYSGDSNFGAGTGSLTNNPQVVNSTIISTTTALTSSQNPSVFGQSVTFTATVSGGGGTPTGTVTFKDGAISIGTGTLSGSGIATLDNLVACCRQSFHHGQLWRGCQFQHQHISGPHPGCGGTTRQH